MSNGSGDRTGPSKGNFLTKVSSGALVDDRTRAFFESKLPDPSESDLDRLFAEARQVQLLEEGALNGEPLGTESLLETSDIVFMASLRELLRFGRTGYHCMCHGDFSLVFRDGSGKRIAVLGLHHGASYRWDNVWASDAELNDPKGLGRLLADHGSPQMLTQQNEDRARESEFRRQYQEWCDAVPNGLPPLDQFTNEFGEVSPEVITAAMTGLASSYPTENEAILAALRWFGSGAGPWSGYPSYEAAAETLLRSWPIASVVRATLDVDLTSSQLEGAARLFAGWQFWKGRKGDRRLVPETLRGQLRSHVLATTDRDKIERFKKAF